MDFNLSKELQMLQKEVRNFVNKKIVPFADQWDNENHFPYEEAVRPMGELGFFGTVIPEEYGGEGMDQGWLAAMIVTEEIARGSSALRVQLNMEVLGCAYTILTYGSEALKKKYVPKLSSAEFLGGFGITEPDAGSDVMAMSSTAEDKGDHWLLNGSKTWISNAAQADVLIYYAYTDKAAGSRGLSAFVIEPRNFPGIKTSNLEKLGSHASPTGELFLDNVKVPKENILGKPGDGARIVFGSLNHTRLSAAAGGVGLAQACLDAAIKYCNERRQFGKPIGDFQMNQDMIAQMAVEVEAARLLAYKAAAAKDEGRLNNGLDVAMAKYAAGEAVSKCANYAMRILGAYGYSTEYPVARFYRDAPTYYMVEGSANICKMIIALDQLGVRKANR
ncbi:MULTISPECIES: glutaryl-CoA dehydrogenase Acd [Desulfococcus]|uniref:Glutaryl-CoA dehydrogenase n=6 Tax=Desulfococcus multivorans TaxID=897 RepID=ACD_DESML|nr:glutaryl-CoA dehydrogenase Acd [Desulfococcus multivorans]C3UVB0.1 RecName: Full=Glutaryl-CoA dehydrogenase; Short=GDH(Des) [Desulfococcus multivorans]ACP50614.1 glutaryl-CoA dehydrogenase [Desulfococcus multivorans]AOY59275.1 AcdA5: acyl-CoA dehydrogenase [Desulfococcus multivorans]AOY60259.1 AcdA13: acyl-CoA dehydrogenase [Desulfococcus multivorans]AQV01497.1 acyl-CoA dehydrogenase [Desulfococcus multivorans]AQV02370.1 acyl-CoA dehydrogenase [Desulfococcus multivorans]